MDKKKVLPLQSDKIKYTLLLGIKENGNVYFDDSYDLGGTEKTFRNYKLIKILIHTAKDSNKNDIIVGLQTEYKNLTTGKRVSLPVRKSNKLYEDEVVHEIELKPGEYFKEFYIRKDKKDNCIYQLGFETNKNNKLMPGANIGDEIKGNLFGKNMVILGLSGDMNKRLNSIQVLYEDFEDYNQRQYLSYFELKIFLKREKAKKEWGKKIKKLTKEYQYLYRTCLLPNTVFFCIMNFFKE